MVDWERGFKRIALIISILGLISIVGGLAGGTYAAIRRYELKNRLTKHPTFETLPEDSQARLRERLKRKFETDYSYSLESFYFVPIGAIWFAGTWGMFYLFRWIVKGFIKSKEEEPSSEKRDNGGKII